MSIADMFFEEGDDLIGTSGNTYAASYKGIQTTIFTSSAKPKNCAGELDLPPLSRLKSNFVGLENQ